MRRLIAALVLFIGICLSATPAEAFWRHHHWRGGWGHHHGWGGHYRGWGGYYRGWGGWVGHHRAWYRPYYGYGYYRPYAVGYYPSYCAPYYPWFGAYNAGGQGTSIGLGYPGSLYANNAYQPTINLSVAPAGIVRRVAGELAARRTAPQSAAPSALVVQKFLGLREGPLTVLAGKPALTPVLTADRTATLDDVLVRLSNVESRRKAERMLNEADALFQAQNYHSALQRYKLAATTAPDLAEAHWRQGHALVATHNYELAATAFKRAIALTDELGRDGFRLNDIYGSAGMAKAQHLESLAEWAMARQHSPDPYFLLGLFLEYDGQPARAEKFFVKASDLAGITGGHIAVFLAPGEDVTPTTRPAAPPALTVPVATISRGTEI